MGIMVLSAIFILNRVRIEKYFIEFLTFISNGIEQFVVVVSKVCILIIFRIKINVMSKSVGNILEILRFERLVCFLVSC